MLHSRRCLPGFQSSSGQARAAFQEDSCGSRVCDGSLPLHVWLWLESIRLGPRRGHPWERCLQPGPGQGEGTGLWRLAAAAVTCSGRSLTLPGPTQT